MNFQQWHLYGNEKSWNNQKKQCFKNEHFPYAYFRGGGNQRYIGDRFSDDFPIKLDSNVNYSYCSYRRGSNNYDFENSHSDINMSNKFWSNGRFQSCNQSKNYYSKYSNFRNSNYRNDRVSSEKPFYPNRCENKEGFHHRSKWPRRRSCDQEFECVDPKNQQKTRSGLNCYKQNVFCVETDSHSKEFKRKKPEENVPSNESLNFKTNHKRKKVDREENYTSSKSDKYFRVKNSKKRTKGTDKKREKKIKRSFGKSEGIKAATPCLNNKKSDEDAIKKDIQSNNTKSNGSNFQLDVDKQSVELNAIKIEVEAVLDLLIDQICSIKSLDVRKKFVVANDENGSIDAVENSDKCRKLPEKVKDVKVNDQKVEEVEEIEDLEAKNKCDGANKGDKSIDGIVETDGVPKEASKISNECSEDIHVNICQNSDEKCVSKTQEDAISADKSVVEQNDQIVNQSMDLTMLKTEKIEQLTDLELFQDLVESFLKDAWCNDNDDDLISICEDESQQCDDDKPSDHALNVKDGSQNKEDIFDSKYSLKNLISQYNIRETPPLVGLEYVTIDKNTREMKCNLCRGYPTVIKAVFIKHVTSFCHMSKYLEFCMNKTYFDLSKKNRMTKMNLYLLCHYANAIKGKQLPTWLPSIVFQRMLNSTILSNLNFLNTHHLKEHSSNLKKYFNHDVKISRFNTMVVFESWALKILEDHFKINEFMTCQKLVNYIDSCGRNEEVLAVDNRSRKSGQESKSGGSNLKTKNSELKSGAKKSKSAINSGLAEKKDSKLKTAAKKEVDEAEVTLHGIPEDEMKSILMMQLCPESSDSTLKAKRIDEGFSAPISKTVSKKRVHFKDDKIKRKDLVNQNCISSHESKSIRQSDKSLVKSCVTTSSLIRKSSNSLSASKPKIKSNHGSIKSDSVSNITSVKSRNAKCPSSTQNVIKVKDNLPKSHRKLTSMGDKTQDTLPLKNSKSNSVKIKADPDAVTSVGNEETQWQSSSCNTNATLKKDKIKKSTDETYDLIRISRSDVPPNKTKSFPVRIKADPDSVISEGNKKIKSQNVTCSSVKTSQESAFLPKVKFIHKKVRDKYQDKAVTLKEGTVIKSMDATCNLISTSHDGSPKGMAKSNSIKMKVERDSVTSCGNQVSRLSKNLTLKDDCAAESPDTTSDSINFDRDNSCQNIAGSIKIKDDPSDILRGIKSPDTTNGLIDTSQDGDSINNKTDSNSYFQNLNRKTCFMSSNNKCKPSNNKRKLSMSEDRLRPKINCDEHPDTWKTRAVQPDSLTDSSVISDTHSMNEYLNYSTMEWSLHEDDNPERSPRPFPNSDVNAPLSCGNKLLKSEQNKSCGSIHLKQQISTGHDNEVSSSCDPRKKIKSSKAPELDTRKTDFPRSAKISKCDGIKYADLNLSSDPRLNSALINEAKKKTESIKETLGKFIRSIPKKESFIRNAIYIPSKKTAHDVYLNTIAKCILAKSKSTPKQKAAISKSHEMRDELNAFSFTQFRLKVNSSDNVVDSTVDIPSPSVQNTKDSKLNLPSLNVVNELRKALNPMGMDCVLNLSKHTIPNLILTNRK